MSANMRLRPPAGSVSGAGGRAVPQWEQYLARTSFFAEHRAHFSVSLRLGIATKCPRSPRIIFKSRTTNAPSSVIEQNALNRSSTSDTSLIRTSLISTKICLAVSRSMPGTVCIARPRARKVRHATEMLWTMLWQQASVNQFEYQCSSVNIHIRMNIRTPVVTVPFVPWMARRVLPDTLNGCE